MSSQQQQQQQQHAAYLSAVRASLHEEQWPRFIGGVMKAQHRQVGAWHTSFEFP
jgi:hypothetical protein